MVTETLRGCTVSCTHCSRSEAKRWGSSARSQASCREQLWAEGARAGWCRQTSRGVPPALWPLLRRAVTCTFSAPAGFSAPCFYWGTDAQQVTGNHPTQCAFPRWGGLQELRGELGPPETAWGQRPPGWDVQALQAIPMPFPDSHAMQDTPATVGVPRPQTQLTGRILHTALHGHTSHLAEGRPRHQTPTRPNPEAPPASVPHHQYVPNPTQFSPHAGGSPDFGSSSSSVYAKADLGGL